MLFEIVWLVRVANGTKIEYMQAVYPTRQEAQAWIDKSDRPAGNLRYEVVWAIPFLGNLRK